MVRQFQAPYDRVRDTSAAPDSAGHSSLGKGHLDLFRQ